MKAAYLRYAIQRCCCCIKKLNCYKVILEFYIHRQPDLCSFAWVRLFFFCAKKASVNHISVKDRGLLQLGFNWVWGDGITHSFYRVSVPFQIFNYKSTLCQVSALTIKQKSISCFSQQHKKTPFPLRRPAKGRVSDSLIDDRAFQHGTSSTFERRAVISSSQRST